MISSTSIVFSDDSLTAKALKLYWARLACLSNKNAIDRSGSLTGFFLVYLSTIDPGIWLYRAF